MVYKWNFLKLCWALTFIKFPAVNTDLCTIKNEWNNRKDIVLGAQLSVCENKIRLKVPQVLTWDVQHQETEDPPLADPIQLSILR